MRKIKNPRILWIIPLLIIIFFTSLPAYAKYSGGTGDPNDPYQIATAEDLMLLGETPEDYDKHFILTADIDLDPNLSGGRVFDSAVIAAGAYVTTGAGFTGIPFTGVFDGNDHMILNLTIDVRTGNTWPFGQISNAGLFGLTGDGANISNLCMEAVDITGSMFVGGLVGFNHGSITGSYSTGSINAISWYAGGLVGFNHGSESSITTSYSTCTINGHQYVGGLVGENSGIITNCYSTGTIIGEENVGGLVGFIEKESITASHSSATVTGNNNIGGLVGENWGGNVTMSYSTGSVVGITVVGGLVGSNRSSVTSSFCTGKVSATNTVGGLVGENSGSVFNTYSTGTVFGESNAGGLMGKNQRGSGRARKPGTINTSYSTARVSGNESVGNLVGFNGDGNISSSFWNTESSVQSASDVGTGLTTAEMQTASTYLEVGWDFVDETTNGTEDIWKISEGLDYPRLWWQKYSGGTGEPNDPYRIATAEDLMLLSDSPDDYNKHFILIADIDLDPNLPGRKVFDKAVIAPDANDAESWFNGTSFRGVFDGNGHTISHLTITGDSYLGVFGLLALEAEVKDLGVEDANITGSGDHIGGLVGFNSAGTVTNCYSIGAISGKEYVGGLVGRSSSIRQRGMLASVTECYSKGTVIGETNVGGLVGMNFDKGASITNCYSASAVTGNENVGGLVGDNNASITRSYSSGSVVGKERVGGLVGYNWLTEYTRGSITASYCTGVVNGEDDIGGLVGVNAWGDVIQCYWDIETSTQNQSDGGTGKTTLEMQTATTFLDAGWDFVDETDNGNDNIWWIDEGNDYPRLWWELIPEN